MASKIREFPKSWAQDRITKYIDAAIHNIVATYQAKGPAYPTLSEVDDIITGMVVGLVNTEFIF